MPCQQIISGVGWEPLDELQESLGPSGPETPKKSEKRLPGPPASKKVWKKSRTYICKTSFQTFRTFFETFSRLFGARGRRRRSLFSDFLGFRARRAWETPAARWGARQGWGWFLSSCICYSSICDNFNWRMICIKSCNHRSWACRQQHRSEVRLVVVPALT